MIKPRVVFTFVEAGMGHIIPMESIYNAFVRKYGDKCEAIKSYIFSDSKSKKMKNLGEIQSNHTKRLASNFLYSKLEGLSYFLGVRLTKFSLSLIYSKYLKCFYEDLKELDCDLIFSSYFLPSYLTERCNKKGLNNIKIATYSPDPYIYPAWDRKCDVFFVNNNGAEKEALKKGFASDKIKKVNFVIREQICRLKSSLKKDEVKKQLALNKKTILFSFGAYGVKGMETLIYKCIDTLPEYDYIVICGKNKKLFDTLTNYKKQNNIENLIIFGFTTEIDKYIYASDLLIGKAGSNTVMESIYLQTPLIVYKETSKLEIETAKYWEKQGLLFREKNIDKIIAIIKNNKQFENYQELSSNFCGNGAEQVADELFEMIKNKM